MNTTTVGPSSIADPVAGHATADTSRCLYRYPNGKRCRLPGLQAHFGFCLGHSKACITNQLLHSHRAIARENEAQAEEPQQIIIDMPRPKRDWPTPEPKIFTGIPGVTPMP